ncbi:UDP-glucuronosyltransferase 2B33-like [Strongylocentrotus purpuratus]|uniref:Glucuronosyltransferase n=1 Tax=Strongylocentrotus purpuratus TaxID=7668 RepID=A0A7M7PL35_STRPU|nr:UDP-glucuronosyltransferase 2B33-like [Strongylocentrotus purpuratus]XP_030852388.1 UDP-glucuronosyltransferase 2B33-like [Strongylocentrotus purpuratus]XP_030852389.1 UDP-glucuronosyltransferase 2B33-like [Strongylocentrotus purpuratus]
MKMELDIWLVLVLLAIISDTGNSANIAFYGGPGVGSHFSTIAALGEELVGRGHNVTAIISGEVTSVKNDVRYAKLFHFTSTNRTASEGKLKDRIDFVARAAVSGDFLGEFAKNKEAMREYWLYDCDDMIKDDDFINSLMEANLDMFIIDPGFGCPNLLPEILKKPFTFFFPTHLEEHLAKALGSPVNVAIRPSYSSGFPLRMTFWQRLHNFLRVEVFPSFITMRMKSTQEYRSLRNISPHSSPTELFSRAELFLVNMDFAVEFPFPISPNVIPVGGITTKPAKLLEQNLEEFVQSSGEDGVIIFTMGSYATYMKEELIREFMTAFSRLPQKIVWKVTLNFPKNIDHSKFKAMSWLPQNDLLAHNKTKLIIFQGGNNGFYEVVYHGVPCVVIPLLEDQYDVASRIIHHGMGVKLDYHTLNADKIEEAVRTVLGNKSYKENTARISSMYGHRTMRPVEKAAFWVEHVIQHGGTHLKSVAGELTWYQYHLVDIVGFLALCVAVVFIILFFVLRIAVRLICTIWWKYRHCKAKKTE